ncbi:MAG TPA: hypothetical protein VHW23_14895 [Kofleriaceae bacterium]|jgi:hypothetical protein|nr:hypothetical protein [Kofleriaceae bacterium]
MRTLEDFNFHFNPESPKTAIIDLATCDFVERHEKRAARWEHRRRQVAHRAGARPSGPLHLGLSRDAPSVKPTASWSTSQVGVAVVKWLAWRN